MAERNMDAIGETSNIKRKVFNVMVECLQNIVKHAEDSEEEELELLKQLAQSETDADKMILYGSQLIIIAKEKGILIVLRVFCFEYFFVGLSEAWQK